MTNLSNLSFSSRNLFPLKLSFYLLSIHTDKDKNKISNSLPLPSPLHAHCPSYIPSIIRTFQVRLPESSDGKVLALGGCGESIYSEASGAEPSTSGCDSSVASGSTSLSVSDQSTASPKYRQKTGNNGRFEAASSSYAEIK